MNRTLAQLREEIRFRKEHGLPRIQLTADELVEAFGDLDLAGERDDAAYDRYLVSRLEHGLTLSLSDKRRARAYLRSQNKVLDKRK